MTCPECAKLKARIDVLQGLLSNMELMLQEPTADCDRALREAFGLTPNEVSILMMLYRAKGRCVGHVNLIDARVKDHIRSSLGFEVLKVYIVRIRKKLGKDAVATNWGKGYSITPEGITKVKAALTAHNLSSE